jgi:hypothetical protein
LKNVTGRAPREPSFAGEDRGCDERQNASLPGSHALREGRLTCGHEVVRGLWGGVSAVQWSDWEWQYRNRVRSLKKLASVMNTPVESLAGYGPVTETYPLAVTPYFLSLMDATEEGDPLRRQCFPDLRELDLALGEDDDPLGEMGAMPVPGLIHRYPDRALAIVTNACAVYCRHCNRKRIWCNQRPRGVRASLQPMIDSGLVAGGPPGDSSRRGPPHRKPGAGHAADACHSGTRCNAEAAQAALVQYAV